MSTTLIMQLANTAHPRIPCTLVDGDTVEEAIKESGGDKDAYFDHLNHSLSFKFIDKIQLEGDNRRGFSKVNSGSTFYIFRSTQH
ncbi:hypothetical protein N9043_00355 [bacterium]|nr:hypothetical protein [bacterium]